MRQEFIEEYNRYLSFLRETNTVLEIMDRYVELLEDLPDSKEVYKYELSSEEELIQTKYSTFYFVKRRFLKRANNVLQNYSDILELSLYDFGKTTLEIIVSTLSDIIDTRNMSMLYGLRPTLLEQAVRWIDGLEDLKDTIAEDLRNKVYKETQQDRSDNTIDSKEASGLLSTARSRIMESVMETIKTDANLRRVREDERQRRLTRISNLLYAKSAFDFLFNKDNLENVGRSFNRWAPRWLRFIAGTETSVSGITDEDKYIAKFSLENLMLKREMKRYDADSTDLTSVSDFWRKKVRKRFGDFPFCDEKPTKIEGKWVVKEDADTQELLEDAKSKLLKGISRNRVPQI